MDINKLSQHLNSPVNNTKTDGAERASNVSGVEKNSGDSPDKVSLSSHSKKSEELFAKIEMEKLNQASFSKLKDYKIKLQEYQAAKNESPEKAKQTEIGKMLDDPAVWGEIAKNIFEK